MKIRDLDLDGTPLEMHEVWIARCPCGNKSIEVKDPGKKIPWCIRCGRAADVEKRTFIQNTGPVYKGILHL